MACNAIKHPRNTFFGCHCEALDYNPVCNIFNFHSPRIISGIHWLPPAILQNLQGSAVYYARPSSFSLLIVF